MTKKMILSRPFKKLSDSVMNVLSCGVILLMFAIVAQVIASRLGVTTIVDLPARWPLFGDAITLNSLADLQGYLMATIALLPAAFVWVNDGHVRVDFAHQYLGERGKAAVEITGHTMFAIPFLLMCIPDAFELALKAFERGEKSANGGLWDRHVIRFMMPVGLSLVLITITLEIWPLVRRLIGKVKS